MVKLFFLGRDARSKFLKELYDGECEIVESIEAADYIILPIPFTKDLIHITGEDSLISDVINKCKNKTVFTGAVKSSYIPLFQENNIRIIDLMELDEVALLNAIPTAEGAIKKAIEETSITLHEANVMVLGFGRVGKILADKLKGLNANVFCEARSKKDLAHIQGLGYNVVELKNIEKHLKNMDVIFSTIPTLILDEARLKLLKEDTVIIDLSSSPGSVDFDVANKLNLKAYLELGIPSRIAPKSAAKYLKQSIDNVIYNK